MKHDPARPLAAILLIALTSAPPLVADNRPMREARSDNGDYLLRIKPGQGAVRPEAALYFRAQGSRRERPLWETKLVNEVSPARALIRDDGKYVVSVDEFQRGGAAHALVIYNAQGKVVAERSLRELLLKDDWQHVRTKGRMVEWSGGADFKFKKDEPKLVIRLRWGRELEIDLDQPAQPAASQAAAEGDIPTEIAELLAGAPTSAPAAQRGSLFYETLNRLIEEEIARSSGEFPFEQMPALVQQAEALVAQSESAGSGLGAAPQADEAAASGDTTQESLTVDVAGVSASVGIPTPLPNPRELVDYVTWINDYTVTESASAQPIYQELIDASPEITLDDALLSAALRGEPEALQNPQVTAWLDAHRDALELFKEAPGYDYRGWHIEAQDGALVSALLPALGKVRQTARAAIVEAKTMESAGRVGEAIDNYMTALEVGGQQGAGVTLIESLVGHAVQSQTAEALLDMMSGAAADAIDYDELARRIDQSYIPGRPMDETIQFERAMVLDLVQRAYAPDPSSGEIRAIPEPAGVNLLEFIEPDPAKRAAAVTTLNEVGFEGIVSQTNAAYDKLTAATQAPFQEASRTLKSITQEIQDPASSERNPFLATLVPSLDRATAGVTRGEATRRATRLVAELKAYRQRYGAYPESLAAFGEVDFAIDPFSEQGFRYELTPDGFRLYSVGADGADDAGAHDRSAATNDLLFWPRPR